MRGQPFMTSNIFYAFTTPPYRSSSCLQTCSCFSPQTMRTSLLHFPCKCANIEIEKSRARSYPKCRLPVPIGGRARRDQINYNCFFVVVRERGRRAADLSPAAATVIGSIGCVAALVRPSPRWLRLSIRAPREIVASL